jgi:hypothetical protein
MRFSGAWYAFGLLAVVVILFELFFRFRYEEAGNRLWRIDRITERACLVQIGDAICAKPRALGFSLRAPRNQDFDSPTPEPNPYK